MPSCVVPTCHVYLGCKSKKAGITFHIFPVDEERKAQWVKLIQQTRPEYWQPKKTSVICSTHFDQKYFFETNTGLRKLHKDAIPSKNMVISMEEPQQCLDASLTLDEEVQSPSKSESLDDVNVSDLDYVFDSPKEIKLKIQLCRKQKLLQKYAKKIGALKQNNKRLMKKNEVLKNIVRKLKNNRTAKMSN